jgi:hypothetical protein
MSRSVLAHDTDSSQATKSRQAPSSLRVNQPGDGFEAEADRVADTVSKGKGIRGWTLSHLEMGRIQRDSTGAPAPAPSTAPKPNNYDEAAAKLAEAFLKTEIGKKLTDAIKNDPLVKGATRLAESFIDTLPGKIIAGAAATGAVSALAAEHKALPAQLPAIPLDKITPGLSVKITWQGPVDKPTQATIGFSYTPKSASDDKKTKQTATEKQRDENASLRADMYKFQEGLKSTQERQLEAAEERQALNTWITRPGALTSGIDVNKYLPATPDKPAGPQLTFPQPQSPFQLKAPTLFDQKLQLQPIPEAGKKEEVPVQRKASNAEPISVDSTGVESVLRSSGRPLDLTTRRSMESRIGFDFSKVRIHADSEAAASARSLSAHAYTVGSDVVFAAGRYSPGTTEGQRLLAHELTHVVQQRGADRSPIAANQPAGAGLESEAARVAEAIHGGARSFPNGRIARRTIQRKVAMRDVGKGEQSGFARVPELITRLNAMSAGLTFAVNGSDLTYSEKVGGTLNEFDRQMKEFIDQTPVIPLRFTNRHGLLGDRVSGYHDRVLADAWSSGYVDIDDLLASSDLGLQSALVHFLRERTATKNYEKRIGSASVDTSDPAVDREFQAAHQQGIQAELRVLRDFLGDPTVQVVPGAESGDVFRVYRNSRRDRIRTRVHEGRGKEAGVDAISLDVVTRDGKVHTIDEYKAILAADRARAAAAAGAAGAAAGSAAAGGAAK